jgi:hypothetical protein
MLRAKALLLVQCVCGLTACAVSPPTGPTVLALPPEGKDLARFQQEDTGCRAYAQAGTAAGTGSVWTSAFELQQRYDIAYAQCMAAHGDRVQSLPLAWLYAPYGYPYAPYDGPWFGPPVAFGFFGFAPGFRHGGHFHHGFHRG